jgi:hypothetical protein
MRIISTGHGVEKERIHHHLFIIQHRIRRGNLHFGVALELLEYSRNQTSSRHYLHFGSTGRSTERILDLV